MSKSRITRSGVTSPENANSVMYRDYERHVSDFMDLWLPRHTVGLDHIFYESGDIEHRIMGYKLDELPEMVQE